MYRAGRLGTVGWWVVQEDCVLLDNLKINDIFVNVWTIFLMYIPSYSLIKLFMAVQLERERKRERERERERERVL